jgi:Protein of unknown function (DUF3485)
VVRNLSILATFGLIAAAGLVHGIWTDRWTPSSALERAVTRLERLPRTIGNWEGHAVALSEEDFREAQIPGFLARRYENRSTKSSVSVLLMCGRSGPISVYTPDICYAGLGFEMVGAAAKKTVRLPSPGRSAQMKFARLRKPDPAAPKQMEVFWAWSATGAWEAPGSPRLTYGRLPALYKLYVFQQRPVPADGSEPPEDDSCEQFLRELLPALDRTLFADL